MDTRKLLKRIIFPLAYLLLIFFCIFTSFNFEGSLNLEGIGRVTLFMLVALTLPWSMGILMLFGWSLFHGAGLEFIAFLFVASACINAYFVRRLGMKDD